MVRTKSVSVDVMQIVTTYFQDGCYVSQVVEKYKEIYPELTQKQARVKVDKSLRFQEKKGYLQSTLDEGEKRRYTITSSGPATSPAVNKPSKQTIDKLRQQCKQFKIDAMTTHIEWQYLKELQKNPELNVEADALAKEAEVKTMELTGKYSALEKILGKFNSCV